MSETLSKRVIERRIAAVSSTGLTVSGVRFARNPFDPDLAKERWENWRSGHSAGLRRYRCEHNIPTPATTDTDTNGGKHNG